jgi:pimeloyl-ACP methyl ester carboxylesterase
MTDILLIAGLWLDGSAWERVASRLRALGHRPVALFLPGQGAPPASATLDDQREAVAAAVDAVAGPSVVVGHSAAATLAWMAADTRPEKVARTVLIGGFPSGDGDIYADFFPMADGRMPFPGWEHFLGPDSADLDELQRADIEARAIPVPEGVALGIVRLGDDRRYDVPVTVVCPEFTPAQAKQWIDAGDVPELASARRVDYLDIDSGHWPMFTRPTELADLLDRVAHA